MCQALRNVSRNISNFGDILPIFLRMLKKPAEKRLPRSRISLEFSRNLTEMLSCKFQLTSFENTPRIHFQKFISKFTSSSFRAMNQKTSAIFAAAPSARRGFRPARPARRRAAAPARSRPVVSKISKPGKF